MSFVQIRHAPGWVRHPAVVVGLLLAASETLPAIYYGRSLASLSPFSAAVSIACSFAGTLALYVFILQLTQRWRWLQIPLAVALAGWVVVLQLIYFGIYREFATLPTVSIVDFARQTPEYAWALFIDRLNLLSICAALLVIAGIAWAIRSGFRPPASGSPRLTWLALVALGSFAAVRAPFMSFGQQAAYLVVKSSHGPGLVNTAWTPERGRPSTAPAAHPINIIFFRLEEVAVQATTLARPALQTTPYLASLATEHASEAFVARQHYSNSTATDVSVLSIYSGLSPAATLEEHRRVPLLWDYFSAAGYDTSLFMPFHLEWGDFRHRFQARPGEFRLNKLLDAGNSGFPIVYDNSINDTDVARAALDYQEKRAWAEPFLAIVSIKMPHAIGEGARVNKLDYGDWPDEPRGLKDYYNGIRHDDELIANFISRVPSATRERTALVFVSDHGTRLFARSDGVEELHRLDNYHQETTRVPFLVFIPEALQRSLPPEKLRNLRTNLETHASSNIDVVPTLLGLAGISPVDSALENAEFVSGRDLTDEIDETDAIVQLNTGPLRRWDREHFAFVLDDARYHYLFSMGRELIFDMRADPSEKEQLAPGVQRSAVLGRARTITAQLPEVLRIQQKYRRANDGGSAMAAELVTTSSLMGTKLVPSGDTPVGKASATSGRLLAEYMLAADDSNKAVEAEFLAKIRAGKGRIEWRLRGGPTLNHFAHSDTLQAPERHRLKFRWRPGSGEERSLAVQLYAFADTEDFRLSVEKSDSRLVRSEGKNHLEVLRFERDVSGRSPDIYHLNKFKAHECLRGKDACPNGYLMWGPYVKGAKGALVQLRYELSIARAGETLLLDLSAAGGAVPLARTRTFTLDEPGSHSFELSTRLARDVQALEGRVSASGGDSLKGYAIEIAGAELTLTPP